MALTKAKTTLIAMMIRKPSDREFCTSNPKAAMARGVVILEMALLTPDAAPEKLGLTVRADLVRGAMIIAMPNPWSTSPGRKKIK